ncbi:GMC oxidoreductase [Microlunatus speluncae]|uniref:GMC oxidoreductase n=1 Tax=Microlunatus speluncae TaxID=2594267 RepID=UPI001C2D0233|nr:GMC oxidoreductase [Microlunatus speluncae]
MINDRAGLLTAVAETIIGTDDPGPWDVVGFLQEVERNERAELGPEVEAVLDQADGLANAEHGRGFIALDHDQRLAVLERLAEQDPRYPWLARLINAHYYSTPHAWSQVGWSAAAADGWPDPLPTISYGQEGWITPAQLRPRYDAVVVGGGAGGGATAQVLAESGRSVLIIEAGTAPPVAELSRDHLRNPRVNFGLDRLTDLRGGGWPRTLEIGGTVTEVGPSDSGWGGNAHTLGGGTRVYGAQAWRFAPDDFRMASRYGIPDGSALADWPISYADLEPFYSEAEWRFGVSGASGGDPWAGPRSREYPMPPIAGNRPGDRLAAGAERLGWSTVPVPLLINSQDHGGRPGCRRCSQCVGFACPVEAKGGTHNTAIPAAVATGNCSVLLGTTVQRLITDPTGRVIAVALVGDHPSGGLWHGEVAAAEFLLGAGAIETARLLLNSAHDHEPAGLGNDHDQVGRQLQGHPYGGALGLFDDEINDLVGPGPAIASCDFRHGNDGIIGGGMIAEEFVPTPASTYDYLVGMGVIPPQGRATSDGMRHWLRRILRVVGPYQELTTADSRIRLDPTVTDRYGSRVARLSGTLHAEDVRGRDFLTERAAEWLTASGASRVIAPRGGRPSGPSGGQHQAGSCRMGSNPRTSVTDPVGRVWGHDNVRLVDGSTHVTNGGVNPVLTILANSLRIAHDVVR